MAVFCEKTFLLVIFLPMQSIVRALKLEHPCIQDPLKASQPPLHLDEQVWVQSVEYLLASQPTGFNRSINFIHEHFFYLEFHTNWVFFKIDSILFGSSNAHKQKKTIS